MVSHYLPGTQDLYLTYTLGLEVGTTKTVHMLVEI